MCAWFRRWRERRTGQRCCDCGTPLSPGAGVSVVHGWRMEGDPRRRCRPCHERYWTACVTRRQEASARLSSGTRPATQARPDDAEQEDHAKRARAVRLDQCQAHGVCVLRWWPRLDPCWPGRRLVAVADVTTRGAWPGRGQL